MNCEQFRERISDYLDDALTAAQKNEMDEHIKACDACRAQLNSLRRITDAMHGMGDEMPVPLPVQAAWRKAVRAEERSASRGRLSVFSRGLATVAAALLVLFGATLVTRQQGAGRLAAQPTALLSIAAEETDEAEAYGGYDSVAESPRFFGATMTDGALKRESPTDTAQPEASAEAAQDSAPTAERAAGSAVRVLRSAQLDIRTDSFESDRMMLENIVLGNEGYFELTTETSETARALMAVARIPVSRLDDFLAELSVVGTMESRTLRADDVSYRFTDLEERLKLCDEKLAKLYALQESCTDVADLMTISTGIEETLSLREKLQGRLSGLTAQEEYARVEIALHEEGAVYELPAAQDAPAPEAEEEAAAAPAEQPATQDAGEADRDVGKRIGEKFSDSVSWLKSFGEDALVLLVGSLPKLVVAVPALVLLIILIRWLVKKKKK